eukprot:scaffold54174_cov18-Tisochrysis_lutea.AAC.3
MGRQGPGFLDNAPQGDCCGFLWGRPPSKGITEALVFIPNESEESPMLSNQSKASMSRGF